MQDQEAQGSQQLHLGHLVHGWEHLWQLSDAPQLPLTINHWTLLTSDTVHPEQWSRWASQSVLLCPHQVLLVEHSDCQMCAPVGSTKSCKASILAVMQMFLNHSGSRYLISSWVLIVVRVWVHQHRFCQVGSWIFGYEIEDVKKTGFILSVCYTPCASRSVSMQRLVARGAKMFAVSATEREFIKWPIVMTCTSSLSVPSLQNLTRKLYPMIWTSTANSLQCLKEPSQSVWLHAGSELSL
jgi:hypothetical protein